MGIADLPDPLPHPDHILIDWDEGTVRIVSPRTKEEKAALDDVIANKHLVIEELREIFISGETTNNPKEHRALRRRWNENFELSNLISMLASEQGED